MAKQNSLYYIGGVVEPQHLNAVEPTNAPQASYAELSNLNIFKWVGLGGQSWQRSLCQYWKGPRFLFDS